MGSEFGALLQHFSECSAQFDALLGEQDGVPAPTPTATERTAQCHQDFVREAAGDMPVNARAR
jgi:hypothetical protein